MNEEIPNAIIANLFLQIQLFVKNNLIKIIPAKMIYLKLDCIKQNIGLYLFRKLFVMVKTEVKEITINDLIMCLT